MVHNEVRYNKLLLHIGTLGINKALSDEHTINIM